METLYDKASLILNPGIYDTGEVYCTKPLDGSGDLTFTRASNATRVGPDGLIEKVRTNYLLQISSWALEGGTISGGFADPDGGTSAYKYVQTTGGIYSNIAFIDTQSKTLSVYLKSVDGTSYNVTLGDGASTGVNVTVTNTWQRFYITRTVGSSRMALYVYGIGNSGGVLLWHAQGELGDFGPTAYIPTTTNARSTFAGITVNGTSVPNVPRLDYTGGGCGKLLLEPSRTNKQTYSEKINTTNYSYSSAISVTENAAISPDGYQNADKVIPTTTNAYHQVRSNLATSNGYDIISVFVKASGYNYVQLTSWADPSSYVNFDLTDGTVGTVSVATIYGIQSYGNGWYRIWANVQASGGGIFGIGVVTSKTAAWAQSFAGNGTDGVLMWGVQIEAASYPTSYISTQNAAVTRVADTATKASVSSLIGQTEGVLYAEVSIAANSDAARVIATLGGSNRFGITAGAGNVGFFIVTGAGGVVYSSSAAFTHGATTKMALAYKSGQTSLYVNGTAVLTTTATFAFDASIDNLFFGNFELVVGTNQNGQRQSQALLFKTRLTNAQMAELTTL